MELGEQKGSMLVENKFEFLFEDAKRRQQYKEKLQDMNHDRECTFHPNRDENVKRRCSIEPINHNKNSSKKELKKRDRGQSIDKSMFKPKIGRPPKNRNDASLPIGEYLYSKNKGIIDNIEKVQLNEFNKVKEASNISHIRKESNQIIEGKKEETFKRIFVLITNNEDAVISSTSINASSII